MVKSNSGRSIHDETQGYNKSPRVEDVGLDSDGFPQRFNPKEVTGSNESEASYQNPDYESQDEVREWETQGEFGPEDEVFDVFNAVMDAPEETLDEDSEVVTDGGQDVYADEAYADGGQPTLEDVDHEGPFDGAPW